MIFDLAFHPKGYKALVCFCSSSANEMNMKEKGSTATLPYPSKPERST